MAKVWACYTAKFKVEVVQYAQEHGIRAVGRKFDIGEMDVRRWSGD
jgi:transposase-like protein